MKQHIEVWNDLDKSNLLIVEVLICREFYALAGMNDKVYCKMPLLMTRTGRSKDVIYRAIRGLEKKGWIERVKGKFSHVRTWKLVHFELTTSKQAVDSKSTESQVLSDYKSNLYIGSKRGIKKKEEKNLPDGEIPEKVLQNLEKKLEEILVYENLEEKLEKEFEKKKKFFKDSVEELVYDELKGKIFKEEVSEMLSKKKEMPNPYMNLKAEDIAKLKIKTEPPIKKIHAGTLCNVWKMCHAEFYPDIFVGQPTMAERGMFKLFLKFATKRHAIPALYFAVKYWITFVKFCQKNGAVGKPTTPKLKYLLKYVKESVTFYLSKQNSITGVYKFAGSSHPVVDLMEPSEKKVPEVKVSKESGSETLSDVPMNLEDAGELYKKLFQKGNK